MRGSRPKGVEPYRSKAGPPHLNTIRELLGHSDYEMTLRYAHLAPEHRREAVEVLDKPGRT